MSQRYDYMVNQLLVLSNAGEIELRQDERFDKLINSSLGLTEAQFQLIEAAASGNISSSDGEVSANVSEMDRDGYYLLQPPLRYGRENAEGRNYMLAYGIFRSRNRIRRIFIRIADPAQIERLYKLSRPVALMRELTDGLLKAPLTPVEHRPKQDRGVVKTITLGTVPAPAKQQSKAKSQETNKPKQPQQKPAAKERSASQEKRKTEPAKASLGSQFPMLGNLLKPAESAPATSLTPAENTAPVEQETAVPVTEAPVVTVIDAEGRPTGVETLGSVAVPVEIAALQLDNSTDGDASAL